MEFGVGVGRGLAELLKREDRWNLSTLSDMIEECVRSDATRASFFFSSLQFSVDSVHLPVVVVLPVINTGV